MIAHKLLIGFKSGEYGGQTMIVVVVTWFPTLFRALSI